MKTKEGFMQLISDSSATEADVHFAHRYCSGALGNQTSRSASFPALIIAKLFFYRQVDYFASEETRGQ